MNWILLAFNVIAELPGILKIVEKAFDGVPDSSDEKKKMAKEMAKALVRGLSGISGADLDAILKRIDVLVDPLIDLFCAVFFKKETV